MKFDTFDFQQTKNWLKPHHKKDVLLKASAAFYPKYRKGGNTFSLAITQAFRYWINHPFQSIFYADTMLSPAMHRATVKKSRDCLAEFKKHITSVFI